MHDPDCDEDPIDNDDFELEEIQDWDDFEDINSAAPAAPIDLVPENACPVCGLNLSGLDTMVRLFNPIHTFMLDCVVCFGWFLMEGRNRPHNAYVLHFLLSLDTRCTCESMPRWVLGGAGTTRTNHFHDIYDRGCYK